MEAKFINAAATMHVCIMKIEEDHLVAYRRESFSPRTILNFGLSDNNHCQQHHL